MPGAPSPRGSIRGPPRGGISRAIILAVDHRSLARRTWSAVEAAYGWLVESARTIWRRLAGLNPLLVDGTFAALLALLSGVEFLAEGRPGLWRLPFAVAAPLPVTLRRRWPTWAWAAATVLSSASLEPPTLAQYLGIVVLIYSVGAHARHRVLSLEAVVVPLVVLQLLVPTAGPPVPRPWQGTLIGFGLWLAGSAVRSWRGRARALEERAQALERERELAARVAVADERARIARELHDVVAHSVSVMVVQAGAARRALGHRPEQAGEAMRAVETAGREALGELRRLLTVLADGRADAGLDPQPGLGELDALIERVRSAGLQVAKTVEGEPQPLSPGIDLAAYRIVQEALTNTLRHAPGARARVTIRYLEHELNLDITDVGGGPPPASSAGAGRGLIGMRERVAMLGGELEVGRREGGFRVSARLPLEPARG